MFSKISWEPFSFFAQVGTGSLRSGGGGGRPVLCRPPSLLNILLSCPFLSSFPCIEGEYPC